MNCLCHIIDSRLKQLSSSSADADVHNAVQVLGCRSQALQACSPDFSVLLNGVVTLQPPPSLPIEEQVVEIYFWNFSVLYQNEDTVRGFLPFLVPMYEGSLDGSALRYV